MRQPHIFSTDMNKPTIITAQQYGTKVSVELDHSDTSLDELMDAFETLIIGLGYHNTAWKEWIVERAAEYDEEENEKWDEDGGFGVKPYTIDDFKKDEEEYENLRHSSDIKYTEEDEKRMDIIGQNGNEGTHYFEDLEWPEPNEELIKAKEKYDKALNIISKKRKPKSIKDIEDEFDLGGNE